MDNTIFSKCSVAFCRRVGVGAILFSIGANSGVFLGNIYKTGLGFGNVAINVAGVAV